LSLASPNNRFARIMRIPISRGDRIAVVLIQGGKDR
jgi:hypothetical protein